MSVATSKVDRQQLAMRLAVSDDPRDQALASVLLMLWDKEEFEDGVKKLHGQMCAECPARKYYEELATSQKDRKDGDDEDVRKVNRRELWRLVWDVVKYGVLALLLALFIIANQTGTKIPALPGLDAAAEGVGK